MADEAAIDILKALAHPLRFAVLEALAEGEKNVGEIERATNIAQPTLSQQLQVLRKAGLVTTRREAKLVFYSTSQEAFERLCDMLEPLKPASTAAVAAKPSSHHRRIGAAVFAQVERN